MPRGGGLIVWLLACLEPAVDRHPRSIEAPIDARSDPPASVGSVVGHGRVVGECAGVVRVEAATADGTVLDRAEAREGSFRLGPISTQPAQLRWGCDVDGDGVVSAEAVASAPVGSVPLIGAVLVLPTS
ncbi:hypothetical protein LBMAG42_46580 [Deltaproteobacteria bacterium]|nr:hypothetical protein LBMAG42_46580 [Deltaproteobacteria bacterium]